MANSSPYQPALLRILHGLAAVLMILAVISGFWVYDIYDQRWLHLGLPKLSDTQGIHGTVGLAFFLLLPAFAVYSFRLGSKRLVQAKSLQHLTTLGPTLGKPVWWISLHRLVNTLTLLVATFAVVTGRMMQEEWLPKGELHQPWYLAHVASWVLVVIGIGCHGLLGAKVGGVPLLLSMVKIEVRSGDAPATWLQGLATAQVDPVLKGLEIIVAIGLVMAFVLPLFSA
ncbi:cytochrome b/b6 domain-containing protein [Prochlorothrix hollandica]|uniref:cytochrome b/b6 domain-containing protein n=1 Tax=Prochlorothrix hollandica TaxID=1223 RepID=UPI0004776D61|nr:cytochrome b/b6 domain-containing protein [Prochlorothrix hollandica]